MTEYVCDWMTEHLCDGEAVVVVVEHVCDWLIDDEGMSGVVRAGRGLVVVLVW
jgi:hypothetical protein